MDSASLGSSVRLRQHTGLSSDFQVRRHTGISFCWLRFNRWTHSAATTFADCPRPLLRCHPFGIKASTMEARHAAALTLVGWYLLIPPFIPHESYNANAPLREWQTWKSFDDESACKAAVSHLNGAQLNSIDPAERYIAMVEQTPGFKFECVASNDPRLAK